MLEYYPNFRVSMYATVYAKLKPCEFADKASDASLLRGGGHLSNLFALAPSSASPPAWETPKRWARDNYLFSVSNAAQLREHLRPIARYYEEVAIPVFARCTTYKELHACVSSDDPKQRIVKRRTIAQLYVAHLAQSPDLARLAEIIMTPTDALACAEDYADQERLKREVQGHFYKSIARAQ